jgi:hypothetical protein
MCVAFNHSCALDTAFGPGDTVEVYTSQKNRVLDTLRSGETHVQPWANTAAYDLPDRFRRHAHKRAYLWIAREYAVHIAPPVGALVWVGFNLVRTVECRKADDAVLILRVPRSILLLSMYEPWWRSVLEGWCTDHDVDWGLHDRWPCACTGHRRRESWETILTVTGNPADWQGVLDRLEPSWLVAAYGPGEEVSGVRTLTCK